MLDTSDRVLMGLMGVGVATALSGQKIFDQELIETLMRRSIAEAKRISSRIETQFKLDRRATPDFSQFDEQLASQRISRAKRLLKDSERRDMEDIDSFRPGEGPGAPGGGGGGGGGGPGDFFPDDDPNDPGDDGDDNDDGPDPDGGDDDDEDDDDDDNDDDDGGDVPMGFLGQVALAHFFGIKPLLRELPLPNLDPIRDLIPDVRPRQFDVDPSVDPDLLARLGDDGNIPGFGLGIGGMGKLADYASAAAVIMGTRGATWYDIDSGLYIGEDAVGQIDVDLQMNVPSNLPPGAGAAQLGVPGVSHNNHIPGGVDHTAFDMDDTSDLVARRGGGVNQQHSMETFDDVIDDMGDFLDQHEQPQRPQRRPPRAAFVDDQPRRVLLNVLDTATNRGWLPLVRRGGGRGAIGYTIANNQDIINAINDLRERGAIHENRDSYEVMPPPSQRQSGVGPIIIRKE